MYYYKNTWTLRNKHLSPHLEIRTDLITKKANMEANLITCDINIKQPMFGANNLTFNRT